jgi:mono/diheme cytochrome c family protein
MAKRIFALALLFIGTCAALWQTKSDAVQTVDFARDIQPIFKANCERCHGAKVSQADLRLDQKSFALKAITPGNSKTSLLMRRILGEGGEARMPMGGEPLKPEQIELIRRWIDAGAMGGDAVLSTQSSALNNHWAFVAPVRPAIPQVKNKAWVKNPIDHFVLAKLEQNGLVPSPEATKTQLIRRVSLDLTGLPPTIAEVEQFVADASPDAYEKLVDRLLASPHYGEQWGRHWLDVARYADTNGFEKDQARTIWPYRDWVIKAINQNMPFDQFTMEQLAGDLLPHPTLDQKIATGFLRNSMRNEEGSVYPEQFRVEGLIDRVDTMGKAFLGLTVNCAQCHTHKFDPIKHDEYYKFYAFFNSDEEPYVEVPSQEVIAKRAALKSKIEKIQDDLLAKDGGLPQRLQAWEAQARQYEDKWEVLKIDSFYSSRAKIEEYCDDGSVRVESYRYPDASFAVKAKTNLKNITGFRLEFLTDPTLRRNGPGVSNDGTLSLSEFAVEATNGDKTEKVIFSQVQSDFERPDSPVKNAIDGDSKTGWNSDAGPGKRNQNRKIVFTAKNPIGFADGTNLAFTLAHNQGSVQITGRFRLSVTTAEKPPFDALPAKVRSILSTPAQQRTKEQQREVLAYFISTDEKCAEASKAIDEALKDYPDSTTTLILAQRSTPRETKIFKRGDWKNKGETVTPDTPAFLHPFPKDAPRNRLGLAEWVTAKENPLTARVIVNRIWQQYFGNGFVASPEDFGTRCETPSHPELLDWLAVEFRDGAMGRQGDGAKKPNAWSIKDLHKLIVMSATYRQASKVTPALLEKDPYNKWLTRAPRLRVEAETIRDLSLAASGLLSQKIGGPPVYPPIPEGVLDLGFGGAMKWETSKGEDRYRRAMYTFWKRSVPYPSLSTFDAPNADVSCPRRVRSNTPLQALTTLNDKMFMEAAQGLALRVWKEGGSDDRSKLRFAFQLCTARLPAQLEEQELLAMLQKEYENFQGKTAMAVYVSAADLDNIPPDIDLHKVAAWTMVARVLLNLDETITRK